MIRRLFMLLLVSIIVVGGSASFRPAQSASSDPCKQDHAAWLTQVLEKMESIKQGMTRWDLLHVFRTEEGVRPMFRKAGHQQDYEKHLSVRTVHISKLTSSSSR